ncbi:hypothetical protein AB3G41_04630 [Mycobacterium kansasii]|uniref:hypothetical protein n=1 Tax=Mycobacterium kansasii TaxID=1768 RepID=UPI0011599FF7|nr:hypothetical protein [Mycobacterium kansasii]
MLGDLVLLEYFGAVAFGGDDHPRFGAYLHDIGGYLISSGGLRRNESGFTILPLRSRSEAAAPRR